MTTDSSFSRYRSRAEPEVATYWTETYHGSKEGIVNTYGPWNGGSNVESMDDVVTPRYRKIIANGGIVNNLCRYVHTQRQVIGDGMADLVWGSFSWTGEGALTQHQALSAGQWDVYCGWPANKADPDRAKLSALANIDSTPYAFGEDTLELKETIEFLKHPLKSILKLTNVSRKNYKKLRRRKGTRNLNSYDARRQATAIRDLYLEYRFAASPLYRSIVDALEAYSAVTPVPSERLTSRGFSKDDTGQITASDVPQYGGATNHFYNLERSRIDEYHASILYEVSNPIHDMKWKLGFRVKDWPTTFWQVVPLSFMVDRLYDVTSFSKAVINLADPNVKILAASLVRKYETTHQWNLAYGVWTNGITGTVLGEVIRDTHFEYTRDPWKPSVKDTIPKLTPRQLVNDALKIADLAAIISSRIPFK